MFVLKDDEGCKDKIAEILLNHEVEEEALHAIEEEIDSSPAYADLFILQLGLVLIAKFYQQLKNNMEQEETNADSLYMPESDKDKH